MQDFFEQLMQTLVTEPGRVQKMMQTWSAAQPQTARKAPAAHLAPAPRHRSTPAP